MHPNTEEHLVSKSPFGTVGVPNDTLKGQISPFWALA